MKIRIAVSAALPILLAFAALATAPGARAQSIEVPPVSNGLWESEATVLMSGGNMPQMAPHTTVTQSCMSPDTWKEFGNGINAHKSPDCKTTNFHQDAHGITYEQQCGKPGSFVSDIRAEFVFDSPQHVHGTIVMKATAPSMPNGMTMNAKIVGHYVSSSCGTMKPGDTKTLKR